MANKSEHFFFFGCIGTDINTNRKNGNTIQCKKLIINYWGNFFNDDEFLYKLK